VCHNEKVAQFAIEGLHSDQRFKTRDFWNSYIRLESGLQQSPGPIIKFEPMIDCIFELEQQGYKNFCGQYLELTESDQLARDALETHWQTWAALHNELIDAYEAIKRDARFGRLVRPVKPSRWVDKTSSQPRSAN